MNNYKTLSKLTQEVITSLSMYQGTATQLYAEDRIANTIVRIFNRLFDKRFWYNNTHWYKYNLTGIDGVCEEDVSKDISKFYDILSISTENNPSYSLRKLNHTTNPYMIKGDRPTYFIPSQIENKIFSIVPFESTGVIYVQARTRPKTFDADTVIPFDPDVLVLGACYEYCADDGNSQTEIQKFQQLYQERLRDLECLENSGMFDYNDEEAYYASSEWR